MTVDMKIFVLDFVGFLFGPLVASAAAAGRQPDFFPNLLVGTWSCSEI
jgi:hypothetical protein